MVNGNADNLSNSAKKKRIEIITELEALTNKLFFVHVGLCSPDAGLSIDFLNTEHHKLFRESLDKLKIAINYMKTVNY